MSQPIPQAPPHKSIRDGSLSPEVSTAPLRLNTFKFALFIAKLFEGDPVCGRTAADRWQLYCTAGAMSSSSSFLII